MLGKLIKYEWKNTYKVCCLLLGVVVVVSLLGWITLGALPNMWEAFDRADTSREIGAVLQSIFSVFVMILYITTLSGINYGMLIYLAVHFYKTTYAKEGYLTHTLPVTKHQILCSKILVSSLWMLFLTICVYISIVGVGIMAVNLLLPNDYTFWEVWREWDISISEVLREVDKELGWDVVSWLVSMLLMLLLGPFTSITILFGSISMGQLFARARVFMAIVCYAGVWVVDMLVSSAIRGIFEAAFSSDFGSYMNISSYSKFNVHVLTAVGLYFISHYVLSKRLNME